MAILSANIRGLSPKKGKFKIPMMSEKARNENIGIITLTESHLHEDFIEGEIQIEGFENFRADRTRGIKKGGIICYVRRDLLPGILTLETGSVGNIEFLVLYIEVLNLILINIYRPPNSKSSDFQAVMHKIRQINQMKLRPTPRIALTGDLNFPSLNWELNNIEACTTETRDQAQVLVSFLEENFLEQLVNLPTRNNNILDIFAINDCDFVSNVEVENTDNQTSDHRLVKIITRIPSPTMHSPDINETSNSSVLNSLNFWSSDIDWNSIRSHLLNHDWDDYSRVTDIDKKLEMLVKIIEDVCIAYVPPKVIKNRSIIPRDRRILFKKRKNLRTKLIGTRNLSVATSLERQLEQIEKDLICSYETELANAEIRAIEKIKEDSKYFYNYARGKSKVRTPVGPLKQGDQTVADPVGMSELLKTQFESVFITQSSPISLDPLLQEPGLRSFEDIDFNENDIEECIMEIPQASTAGPDGIPAILLRKCVAELKGPIHQLWRASLDVGKLPQQTKLSIVTPVFKGGDRCLTENYRPISLITHLCKVFERVVVKELTKYLNKACLFNDGQHGFRSGRSCLSQLLEHHQSILQALENNAAVDVVYLDFAKAFDKVDYNVLLKKLKSIGITGNVLKWLADFLIGRRQKVKVCGQLSSEGPVHSGVPQGSSLGPLLFLIMVSDIDCSVKYASVSSFADDTRMLMKINSEEDCGRMQDDLIEIYTWASDNNMKFNSKKFELLNYSARNRDLHVINESSRMFNYPQYHDPDGNTIRSVGSLRDLGVTINSDATFAAQINKSVTKASRYAGWILRVFQTREHFAMMTLFKSMVLPHIEYCCPLWSPTNLGLIRQIEAVQRSFTSKIHNLQGENYWGRLKILNLYSLERRRERYQIIYVFKILKGYIPNLISDKFKIRFDISARRGRTCKLPSINSRSLASVNSMIESSFYVRGPKLFNCLPAKLRNFDGSTDSFKSQLDGFLSKIPDQPCLPAYQQPALSNSIIDQLAAQRADGIFHA